MFGSKDVGAELNKLSAISCGTDYRSQMCNYFDVGAELNKFSAISCGVDESELELVFRSGYFSYLLSGTFGLEYNKRLGIPPPPLNLEKEAVERAGCRYKTPHSPRARCG